MHSLGLRLLREHPVEAGLDPAAAVLPDDEAELLRRAACIEAIDAAAEADDERTAALRGIGVYHAGLRLPRMVAQRDAVEAAFVAMGADSAGWPAHVRAILGRTLRAATDVDPGAGPGDRLADQARRRRRERTGSPRSCATSWRHSARPARRTPGKSSSPSSATRRRAYD